MKVLIIYGTTEGQTRKIAVFMAAKLRELGHEATLCDSTYSPLSPNGFDAVLIGSSVHVGKYHTSVQNYIQRNKQLLNQLHTGFFSVSLTAASDDEQSWTELKDLTNTFLENTGWKPSAVEYIAGALLFTEYDFMKKFIMRIIAKKAGHGGDTEHDTEYTNWNNLTAFIKKFMDNWLPPVQTVGTRETDKEAVA